QVCSPLRALIFAKLSAVEETPSPAAPPMRKTRSLLAIRNPTRWAEVVSRVPPINAIGIQYTLACPGPEDGAGFRHKPFGHRDVPDANDVRAVPDLPKHPKPLGPDSHCVPAHGSGLIS